MNTSENSSLINPAIICRLCLNYTTDFTYLKDGSPLLHSYIIDSLPNINLELSENPLICTSCSTNVQQFNTFKDLCVKNERVVRSYYARNKQKLKGGKKVYLNEVLNFQNQQEIEQMIDFKEQSIENDYINDCMDVEVYKDELVTLQNELNDINKEMEKNSRELSIVRKAKLEEINNSATKLNQDPLDLDNNVKLDETDDYFDFREDNSHDDPFNDKDIQECKSKENEATNESEKPSEFTCDVCGKVYTNKNYFRNHMNGHNNKHLCYQCGKLFTSHHGIQEHLLTHTNEKPFECEICCKRFLSKGYLRTHLIMHQEKKSNVCTICSKDYRNNSCYRKHMRIHEEEAIIAAGGVIPPRPFPCSHCSKEFHLKADLKNHVSITHLEFKSFICGTCGKQFYTKKRLARHEFIHTGLKPYLCTECGKSFGRSGHLRLHLRTVHKRQLD